MELLEERRNKIFNKSENSAAEQVVALLLFALVIPGNSRLSMKLFVLLLWVDILSWSPCVSWGHHPPTAGKKMKHRSLN